jgi:CheY-like chemotaxis protein
MTYGTQPFENTAPPAAVDGMEMRYQHQKKQDSHDFRCLVVDDDKNVLKFVAFMFSRLGYHNVDTAQEKPELINKLTNSPYDILVTDLEMPDINGFDLSHTIKMRARDTKVIIMTGRHKNEILDMMESEWVDGWLFKPFGVKELRYELIGLGLYYQ